MAVGWRLDRGTGRILEFRTAQNGFRSVEQLREIKGLGGKTGAELMTSVRVGP